MVAALVGLDAGLDCWIGLDLGCVARDKLAIIRHVHPPPPSHSPHPTLIPHENGKNHSPKRTRQKAHRTPHVHRVSQHVKWEALDTVIHQDSKVVTKKSACDAEGPCGGDDEGLPYDEERGGDQKVKRGRKEGEVRLRGDGALVAGQSTGECKTRVYISAEGGAAYRESRKSPAEKMQTARK